MANGSFNTSESVIKKLLENVIQNELQPVNDKLQKIDGRVERLERQVNDFRDEVVTLKDEIIAELQTMREESAIDKGLHRRVLDIEDDVDQLKKIHPRGTHQPTL